MALIKKTTANLLQGKRLKPFPVKSGTRQGDQLSSLPFNIGLKSSRQQLGGRKSIKTGKSKYDYLCDGMILDIEISANQ